ncbi:TrpR-like protein YerC/YecD [Candidatus Dojkabacteria bacterium]|uniref:TrpR-like protein YerC/YecD n=1 Tax=Candidatus Dojkabacteria bacterium TaxID=2099670 RepID=A0A955L9M3_9BACT|nr:TrpR-like protein YerC/YecD [Candidatus Dojkabacteria bacterium]
MISSKYTETISSPKFLNFFRTFLKLRTEEEITKFLLDLMTIKELETFASRWQVAEMLHEGRPYTEIERLTGLSSATIARVSESLQYGHDGYKIVFDRLNK